MTYRRFALSAAMALLISVGAGAQQSDVKIPDASAGAAPASQAETPQTEQEKAQAARRRQISYYLGINIGMGLKNQGIGNPDFDALFQGVRDAYAGKSQLNEQQLKAAKDMLDTEMQALAKRFHEIAAENQKKGDAFRGDYAKKDGVKSTADGLLYRVINAGSGANPKDEDKVKVTYSGKHVDGTQFLKPTEAIVPVGEIKVKGLKEAIQMMAPGAEWEIVIPPDLGFGNVAQPNVGPGSTLVVDITLHEINPPEPPKVTAPAGEGATNATKP